MAARKIKLDIPDHVLHRRPFERAALKSLNDTVDKLVKVAHMDRAGAEAYLLDAVKHLDLIIATSVREQ